MILKVAENGRYNKKLTSEVAKYANEDILFSVSGIEKRDLSLNIKSAGGWGNSRVGNLRISNDNFIEGMNCRLFSKK